MKIFENLEKFEISQEISLWEVFKSIFLQMTLSLKFILYVTTNFSLPLALNIFTDPKQDSKAAHTFLLWRLLYKKRFPIVRAISADTLLLDYKPF